MGSMVALDVVNIYVIFFLNIIPYMCTISIYIYLILYICTNIHIFGKTKYITSVTE